MVPEVEDGPLGEDESAEVSASNPRALEAPFQILRPPSPNLETRDTEHLPRQTVSGGNEVAEGGRNSGGRNLGGAGEAQFRQYIQLKAPAISGRDQARLSAFVAPQAQQAQRAQQALRAQQAQQCDEACAKDIDSLSTQTADDVNSKYAATRNHLNQQVL